MPVTQPGQNESYDLRRSILAKKNIVLNVNGENRPVLVELDEPLLWVLRDDLGLTGTKFGCGTGECGVCSVLIDGDVRRSCRVPVAYAVGREIVTIEGLGTPGNLSPLQQAFLEHTAFGCGFCTPGMIITATALLAKNPHPTREEIIQAMDNNLCRCGSYLNVIQAIESFIETQGGE